MRLSSHHEVQPSPAIKAGAHGGSLQKPYLNVISL